MWPIQIRMEDYTYELLDERIARFPLANRSKSKLLIFKEQQISQGAFSDLPGLLPEGSLLFWNDTRVIQARILFTKTTGGVIEVFLLQPESPPEYNLMFESRGQCVWNATIGNQKKWKSGTLSRVVHSGEGTITLTAEWLEGTGANTTVRLSWEPVTVPFVQILDLFGETPIPPYLKREAVADDKHRYQTVYADFEGSVAAPTAGLHFTQEVIDELKYRFIQILPVTLHVGAGTFKPVKSSILADHQMHAEPVMIHRSVIHELMQTPLKPVTAIGTTTLRSLESLYWIGEKIRTGHLTLDQPLELGQWDSYSLNNAASIQGVMSCLLDYLDSIGSDHIEFVTRLFIVPGYRFRVVDRLVTNFHQPLSTLLLLVAAFTGDSWKTIYRYALDHDFRFLSYGDSSLLERRL